MKKVLIVGGLGYVGGRLARHLSELGVYHVVTSTHRNISALNLDSHRGEVIQLSLDDSTSELENTLKQFDCIIYLAALNFNQSIYTSDAYKVNVVYLDNIIKACSHHAKKRFIYLSTAHVYGAALKGNVTEDTIPAPLSNYAITHLAAEHHVLSAHYKDTIDGVVLRLANTFGPPASVDADCWTLLLNDLARQIVQEKKCRLLTPGLQRRDFIAMTQLVRCIASLLDLSSHDTVPLYNVGSGDVITVREAARKLVQCANESGLSVVLEYPDSHDAYVGDYNYSIDRLNSVINLERETLDEELYALLEFCRKNVALRLC